MSIRTCKVGIHGRNHEEWQDLDFQVLREAGVEVIKAMSQTRPHHFERMKRENPNVEIITRLHGDGFGTGHHPGPAQFAGQMIPVMANLRPYCTKFHVQNEPNHVQLYEGWGPTDDDARSFNTWFLEVYQRLKEAHPWASIGFPGLAVGDADHRESAWLRICRPAIERADWLGAHCYWQTPPGQSGYHLSPDWGLRFQLHHSLYPQKTLEILECGNSNDQRPAKDWPISDETIANEYVQWLQEVFKYPYINSASFYILSSHDPTWSFFSWRTENGAIRPMVYRVGAMFRPQWTPVNAPPPEPKPALPVNTPAGLTNQMVINAFNRASLDLGLGGWDLLQRAGLDLKALAANQETRRALYSGPKLDQLPNLTDDQRRLIRSHLPDDVSFAPAAPAAPGGFLKESLELLLISLTPPLRLSKPRGALETRIVQAWNRYGNLLVGIADRLGIDLALAVAVVAAEGDPRGMVAGNRLVLRFEPHLFYQRWGQNQRERFAEHFQFDPARPWQGHRWRAAADKPWRELHGSLADEWGALSLARTLDDAAACEATALGFAGMLGANFADAGYRSAAQMLDAFASSERFQVLARFDLLAGPGGDSRQVAALRSQDLARYAGLAAAPNDAARLAGALAAAADAFRRLSATH